MFNSFNIALKIYSKFILQIFFHIFNFKKVVLFLFLLYYKNVIDNWLSFMYTVKKYVILLHFL